MNKPVVLGVAGGTGSGKTTVAESLLESMGRGRVAYMPHDAYYRHNPHLSSDERAMVNYDHPNSLESELMVSQVEALIRGESIARPVYDFEAHLRAEETVAVSPQPIILIEGILIFAEPALRHLMDIKVFVDTDADVRFIRRLRRDVNERGRSNDSVIEQYLSTVRPMHLEFVEPSKRFADVIVPEGGRNEVAMKMVTARLAELLGAES